MAAAVGNIELTKVLIANKKIDIEKQNNLHKTPLITALEHCHYNVAKLLIDAKANVNRADSSGITAVHLAIGIFLFFI